MAAERAQPTSTPSSYASGRRGARMGTQRSRNSSFAAQSHGVAAQRHLSMLFTVVLAAALSLGVMVLGSPAFANEKYASIVIDAGTGEILHQEDAAEKRFPASLTKMMTLYMLFEALDRRRFGIESALQVSSKAAQQPPSKLGLVTGSSITVEQAILALVTKSANDVAVVVAEAIGRSERGFARLMTRKARALGMTDTVFQNASGLPNAKQVTTARDMAQLSRALLYHFPHYYHYFSTESFTFKGKTYRSHNRLLDSYEGLDGLKTGYIDASGFNLAASAVRGGRRLIAVVFGGRKARTRDERVVELLDLGFQEIKQSPPLAVANASSPPPAPVPANRPVLAQSTVETDVGSRGSEVPVAASPRADDRTAWGIQVGAYSRFGTAHLAVSQAARHVPQILNNTKVAIVPLDRGKATLYRARMVGLTHEDASQACEVLLRKKLQCLTVPPNDETRAILRSE